MKYYQINLKLTPYLSEHTHVPTEHAPIFHQIAPKTLDTMKPSLSTRSTRYAIHVRPNGNTGVITIHHPSTGEHIGSLSYNRTQKTGHILSDMTKKKGNTDHAMMPEVITHLHDHHNMNFFSSTSLTDAGRKVWEGMAGTKSKPGTHHVHVVSDKGGSLKSVDNDVAAEKMKSHIESSKSPVAHKQFWLGKRRQLPVEEATNIAAKDYETSIAKKLHSVGRGTGASAGSDSKKSDATMIADDGSHHDVEIKRSAQSRVHATAVYHHPEKGWSVAERTKIGRPEYAKKIAESGILDKLNKEWGNPDGKKLQDVYHDDANGLETSNAHYTDKKVPYIHIGGHGLFKTSDTDPAKLNVPKLSGKAKLRARFKGTYRNKDGKLVGHTVVEGFSSKKDIPQSPYSLDADPS
jgi:hypothetical protein